MRQTPQTTRIHNDPLELRYLRHLLGCQACLELNMMSGKGFSKLIYVVDDRFDIAQVMAKVLREQGYDALPFCSPLDALWAASSQEPELLLTDLSMPTMDGYRLAASMREQHPNCRVLVMSADPVLRRVDPNPGGYELIPKPVSADFLVRHVRQALSNVSGARAN